MMNSDQPLFDKHQRKVCDRRRSMKKTSGLNINNRAQCLYTYVDPEMDDSPKSALFKQNPHNYRKSKRALEKIKRRKRNRDAVEESSWHEHTYEGVVGTEEENYLLEENQFNEKTRVENDALYSKINSLKQTSPPNDQSNWDTLMYCTSEQLIDYEFDLLGSIGILKNQMCSDKEMLQSLKQKYYHLCVAKSAQTLWLN
jgi:hypothetical protein